MAEACVSLGYPGVEPILPELLEWLQDYNWPVAHVLGPFLSSIGLPMLTYVRKVPEGTDDIWKYWVLSCVIEDSPQLASALRQDLLRFANAPTANERAEDVHRKAKDILAGLNEKA
jgi:hypothetical protein